MKTKEPYIRFGKGSMVKCDITRTEDELVQDEMKRILPHRTLTELTTEEWFQVYDAVQLIMKVRNRYKKVR